MDATPIRLDEETVKALTGQLALTVYQAEAKEGRVVSRAWLFQDPKQVEKHGEEAASWYVGWIDPEGHQRCKSCGPGPAGKRNAGKLRRQTEAELLTGTYRSGLNVSWEDFRRQYADKILAGKSPSTRRQAEMSLANFERLVNPKKVSAIKTAHLDQFTAARRLEPRRNSEAEPVSPASVNADLRNLKAALHVAHEWGYLTELPRVRMLKLAKKFPRYMPPDVFVQLYRAADRAWLPQLQGCAPADWWRALLVTCYVATGWRIGQLLDLRREDLDLAAGTAVTSGDAVGNKAKADRLVKLHPTALEHLKKIQGFDPHVFPWPHDRRTLSAHLEKLQRLAGVERPYSWHGLRKAFGTLNAKRLDPKALQNLMQHASIQTTMDFYVSPLEEMDKDVQKLHVPKGLTG